MMWCKVDGTRNQQVEGNTGTFHIGQHHLPMCNMLHRAGYHIPHMPMISMAYICNPGGYI
jgi:hypothetical protein